MTMRATWSRWPPQKGWRRQVMAACSANLCMPNRNFSVQIASALIQSRRPAPNWMMRRARDRILRSVLRGRKPTILPLESIRPSRDFATRPGSPACSQRPAFHSKRGPDYGRNSNHLRGSENPELCRSCCRGQHENRAFGEEIRPPGVALHVAYAAFGVEREGLFDGGAARARQREKIGDRAEMDVRGFIPAIAKRRCLRHPPVDQ